MLSIDNEKQRREILEQDKAKIIDEFEKLRKALDNEKKERAELETKKAVLEAKLDGVNKLLEKEKDIREEFRQRAKKEGVPKAKEISNKKVEKLKTAAHQI